MSPSGAESVSIYLLIIEMQQHTHNISISLYKFETQQRVYFFDLEALIMSSVSATCNSIYNMSAFLY